MDLRIFTAVTPLAITILFCVLCGDLSAKTIKVPKGGSIGDTLLQAAPGDKIIVPAGTYRERFAIPASLEGLRIVGKGRVVVDARPLATDPGGPGISIAAANVTLQDLIVRGAKDGPTDGNGIVATALGVTLRDVEVWGCASAGIRTHGPGALLERCVAFGNEDNIYVAGASSRVLRCESRAAKSFGITVVASECRVDRCKSSGSDTATALYLAGTAIQAVRNAVVDSGAWGIAFFVEGGTLKKNVVRGSRNPAMPSILVAGGMNHVVGNQVEDGHSIGILVSGSQNVLVKNRVRGLSHGKTAFEVPGHVNELRKNRAEDVGGDGFYVTGSQTLLEACVAKRCLMDGIDVQAGSGNQIVGCTILENGDEGLENNGVNTVASGNVAKRNGLDVANDGSFFDFLKNKFDTGGPTVAPDVD